MTMCAGMILNGSVFLASDKRTTQLNADGSNGIYDDLSCKILPLAPQTLVFVGGITAASNPLKAKLLNAYRGKTLEDSNFKEIAELCRQAYGDFMNNVDDKLKANVWLKDFTVSVIIGQNDNGKPRLVRFDSEDSFEPVIRTDQGSLCIKSAIEPEKLWPEVQKIAANLQLTGFDISRFFIEIFDKAASMETSISRQHDLFFLAPSPPPKKHNSYAFQKLTAGTITATISIIGPTITGGTIQTATSGKRIKIFNNQLNSLNGNTKEGFSIEQYNAGGYTAFCGLMYRNGSILGGLVDFNDGALSLYSNANLGTYGQDLIVSGGRSLILKSGDYGIVCVGSATADNTVVVYGDLDNYATKRWVEENFTPL